jgi:hypothetical protein
VKGVPRRPSGQDSDVLQGVSLAVDWSQVVDLLGPGAIQEAASRRARAAVC